jgi:GDP-4-dehydro-6-deoxy-D-mannose reductase
VTSVLVTGAAGFVGRALVPTLRAAGHEVATLVRTDGDVCDAATWQALPRTDVVVHLAARQFVPDSWKEPAEFLRVNVQGTAAALAHARRHGARCVFLSSYLYGQPAFLPIAEDAPLQAVNPYALSKQLAEAVCEFHAAHLNVPVAVLRPFNLYGPGQAEEFLLPSIMRQALSGRAIRVKDLEPRRDYVHLHDVLGAIRAAIGFRGDWGVFNVGSGRSYSVAEVIALVQAALGTDLPVESEGVRRPGEILDTVADIRRAADVLGWAPTVSFEAGIRAMCEAARPLP